MTALEIKQKELDRINILIGQGDLSLLATKATLDAEFAALKLQENGNNVQIVTPDDLENGVLQVETATVIGAIAGVAQVETATVVGTIEAAGAGDATVTITSALITDNELVVQVAVANDDTASLVAGKIRAALALETEITDHYAISGTDADIVLTSLLNTLANDATLNIAIDNGTCAGLTAAPTSANTTAGVSGAGNATVIFTSAHVSGSPKTKNVAVAAGDDASAIATKIRAALTADTDIAAEFTISGTGAAVVATAKNYYGNDTTLNMNIANGTCSGITTAATSANTTAGVAASGSLAVTAGKVFCSGDEEGLSVELPSAVLVSGQSVTLMKTDSGAQAVTITTYGSEKINGQDTYVLDDQYDTVTLVSNGEHWFIVSKIAAD